MSERELPVATGLMTPSSGEYIAELVGEPSLRHLAQILPHNSLVLDLGSGKSDLGDGIASLRPDVTTVNLDIQYATKADQLNKARVDAPNNLSFVAGAASKLPFHDSSFDRVFSYNLISHFMRYDPDLGRRSILELLRVLKPAGEAWVGPTNANMKTADRWNMVRLGATASDGEIDEALAELTTPPQSGRAYQAMAASGVGVFPRKRIEPGRKGFLLSDPKTEDYYPAISPHGVRLGVTTCQGCTEPRIADYA